MCKYSLSESQDKAMKRSEGFNFATDLTIHIISKYNYG